MRVAVIGGGLTGLSAARRLRARGAAVTLVDRAARAGGRLRPSEVIVPNLGTARFDAVIPLLGTRDHGSYNWDAPVELPPVTLFAHTSGPQAANLFRTVQCVHTSPGASGVPFPRQVPAGGARGLYEPLLPGCDEHFEHRQWTEAVALVRDGAEWVVRVCEVDGRGTRIPARSARADAVLLTVPVPALLALLDASGIPAEAARDDLSAVLYTRALVLEAAFGAQGPGTSPVYTFADAPLEVLFDNQTTEASAVGPALTGVSAAAWADEHWHEPDAEIAARLLPLASAGLGPAVWHRVRRFERYRAERRVRMPFVELDGTSTLLAAGDAFAGFVANPFDAAHTSGARAAERILRALTIAARNAQNLRPLTPARPLLEVVVTCWDEATAALSEGADRLFVLAAPEVGGLTPSFDTFLAVRAAADARAAVCGHSVPVTVLLRPRLGTCEYRSGELQQMEADADRFLSAGADGIAFAALENFGTEFRMDRRACAPLVARAHKKGRHAVFHRAFDRVRDRQSGLQDLIGLEFDRVITAGGGATGLAQDSAHRLRADVAFAAWDLEVTVAGGIGPGRAASVASATGCRSLLGAFREPREPAPLGTVRFGPPHRPFRQARVCAVLAELNDWLAEPDAD
jgi:copper homeostasis protein